MYRIIKIDGTELGITDSVNYIKIGSSGDLTNATETDAIGSHLTANPIIYLVMMILMVQTLLSFLRLMVEVWPMNSVVLWMS